MAVILLRGGTAAHHLAPKSVQAGGHRLPYVGVVPWANPVSDSRDPDVIYVFADNDHVHASNVCHVTADRAIVVDETARHVTILIAGYGAPMDAGSDCDGAGTRPSPVAVPLQSPVAGRTVIDVSDGKPHPVLDASTVPRPKSVPAVCGSPAVLRWDEKTSVSTQTYLPPLPRGRPSRCIIVIDYGPTAAIDALDNAPGFQVRPVQISGATATVVRYNDVNNHNFVLEWTPHKGTEIRLQVHSAPASPLTETDVLAIARSIK
ncbi:MAG: hypothetical protein ACRDVG_14350 [Jatrophihabitantaceae bacterium]